MAEPIANILGTFLGALLGIPSGLALNHAWKKRVDAARRNQLLSALKASLDKNKHLITEINKWVGQTGGTPFFNVDTTVLESTAAIKYDLLNDIDLCRKIDYLRFELIHLSRKVNILLDLEFHPSSRLAIDCPEGSMYNKLRPILVQSIHSHIDSIQDTIESLEPQLK